MVIKYSKHILFFTIFFVIFYFEPVNFGGLKFSHLWKIPLILTAGIFVILKKLKTSKLSFWGYLYSIKYFITPSLFLSLSNSFLMMVRNLTIPLFSHVFLSNSFSVKKIHKILLSLSIYSIVSSIPFLLGLITPMGRSLALDKYGLGEMGFTGIHQGGGSCAYVTATSMLVIIFFLRFEKRLIPRLFYYTLIAVSVIVLYKVFIRTGWVLSLLGLYFIFVHKQSISKFIKLSPLILAFVLGLLFFYNNNEALQMRITDKTVYRHNDAGFSKIGSGRLVFATTNITNWYKGGFNIIFFGMGFTLSVKKMEEVLGYGLASHNGYADVIAHNGIFGIIIFFLFLLNIYKSLKRSKKSKYSKLAFAIYFNYIVFLFLQGGSWFLFDLLVTLVFVLAIKDSNNNKLKKIND